jgi:hypothetical protein
MKILYLALFPILLSAQQLQPVTSVQADCQKFMSPIVTAGTFFSATVDNRQAACDGWTVTYSSFGFATVSVLLQDAPLTTAAAAGTFVTYGGTIVTGFSNPATSTTSGEIRTAGATTTGVYFPYVRVRITTTGAGILFAEFHGFKTNSNSGNGGGGAGSGCPGTVGTPCVVTGVDPTGSAPSAPNNPVMVAGLQANGTLRTVLVNSAGAVAVLPGVTPGGTNVGIATDNGSNVSLAVTTPFLSDGNSNQGPMLSNAAGSTIAVLEYPYLFNGATWDRARGDATGGAIEQGAGVAGTPAGGVLSVQGVAGGTALPVSVASLPALPANQSINLAQVAGTNTVTGGVAGSLGIGGLAAAGAAIAGNSVRVGGVDGGGLKRDILTDTSGRVQVVGAAADGATAAGNPVLMAAVNGGGNANTLRTGNAQADGVNGANNLAIVPYTWNGATWDRQFICPNQALVTLADTTLTALVTVSGSTVVRVCSVHVTTSGAAETVSLIQGTGVACAGSPVTIDAYLGVTAFVTDYSPSAALRTAASNGLCVQQSGAAQAAKVWVSYAQF